MKWTLVLLMVAVCGLVVVDAKGFIFGPSCRRRCRDAGMVYVGRLNGNCICTTSVVDIGSAQNARQPKT